jgi:hypothetical protein
MARTRTTSPSAATTATTAPHPRSARGEEDQEETTVAERTDAAEEWRQWQSRRARTPARRWTQAGGLSELLHDKVITDLQEGGKGPLLGDPRPELGVAVTEPMEDVTIHVKILVIHTEFLHNSYCCKLYYQQVAYGMLKHGALIAKFADEIRVRNYT